MVTSNIWGGGVACFTDVRGLGCAAHHTLRVLDLLHLRAGREVFWGQEACGGGGGAGGTNDGCRGPTICTIHPHVARRRRDGKAGVGVGGFQRIAAVGYAEPGHSGPRAGSQPRGGTPGSLSPAAPQPFRSLHPPPPTPGPAPFAAPPPATAPSPGRPTPGVVEQDKSSRSSVDTTKTRLDPQRVGMSSGERPIGAAKGTQTNTMASCQPPSPRPRALSPAHVTARPNADGPDGAQRPLSRPTPQRLPRRMLRPLPLANTAGLRGAGAAQRCRCPPRAGAMCLGALALLLLCTALGPARPRGPTASQSVGLRVTHGPAGTPRGPGRGVGGDPGDADWGPAARRMARGGGRDEGAGRVRRAAAAAFLGRPRDAAPRAAAPRPGGARGHPTPSGPPGGAGGRQRGRRLVQCLVAVALGAAVVLGRRGCTAPADGARVFPFNAPTPSVPKGPERRALSAARSGAPAAAPSAEGRGSAAKRVPRPRPQMRARAVPLGADARGARAATAAQPQPEPTAERGRFDAWPPAPGPRRASAGAGPGGAPPGPVAGARRGTAPATPAAWRAAAVVSAPAEPDPPRAPRRPRRPAGRLRPRWRRMRAYEGPAGAARRMEAALALPALGVRLFVGPSAVPGAGRGLFVGLLEGREEVVVPEGTCLAGYARGAFRAREAGDKAVLYAFTGAGQSVFFGGAVMPLGDALVQVCHWGSGAAAAGQRALRPPPPPLPQPAPLSPKPQPPPAP